MKQIDYIKDFEIYLKLERGLSANSVESYMRDINKLYSYFDERNIKFEDVQLSDLQEFINFIAELGMLASSRARLVSAIKTFYKFLLIYEYIDASPADLLEAPKIGQKLPDVINHKEVERIISAIDLSSAEGERNKAIIETLYGCGLRVSELINLKISNLYFDDDFIKVTGKGSKQRLVPIGRSAKKQINIYKDQIRVHQNIQKGEEDILFLNRRGKRLTRVMIYTIIKRLTELCGIHKNVSPHTFRHTFASELIEGGANLRAVQEMLGHESISTTQIYTHLDKKFLRETLNKYHPLNRN